MKVKGFSAFAEAVQLYSDNNVKSFSAQTDSTPTVNSSTLMKVTLQAEDFRMCKTVIHPYNQGMSGFKRVQKKGKRNDGYCVPCKRQHGSH